MAYILLYIAIRINNNWGVVMNFNLVLVFSMMSITFQVNAMVQNKSYKEIINSETTNCIARESGHVSSTTVYEVKQAVKDFKVMLAHAGSKGSGNGGDNDYKGCIPQTINSFEDVLIDLNLSQEFSKVATRIKEIYPNVDIDKTAQETLFCKTNKRLESLIGYGIGYRKNRTMVWKPKTNNNKNRIMYNEKPTYSTSNEKEVVLWSLVKEMLQNRTHGSDYWLRDAQLQIIMRSLQAHIALDEMSEEELKEVTNQFDFPTEQ
jgi:hypothetical protein